MSLPSEPQYSRPSRSLSGKVAIVTGAGCSDPNGIGNGRAISILLAEDSCTVVCVDLNLSWAEQTVAMIKAEGKGTATAMQADVTSATSCEDIIKRTISLYGRLDILINNVGIGGAPGTAVDVDMQAWAKGLEINVSSMVLMAKYAIPEMLKNKGQDDGFGIKGSIVNMGSVAGLKGGTPHLLYPTTKGAIVNMTRTMAAHHAKDGIRVNCVCPGVRTFNFPLKTLCFSNPLPSHTHTQTQMLYTPMMYGSGSMTAETRLARRNRSLLGTEGNGWDAGAAVRFLAGNEARWMTGVILPVDAGATAAIGIDMPKGASVNG